MGEIRVVETVATGHEQVERTYTDDEILELFPDGDGTIVNPLLRRAKAAEAEIEQLRALISRADLALTLVVRWAQFTYQHWNSVHDSKVGKCLSALAGELPGYAPDTDGIHAYRQEIRSYRNAALAEKGNQR